MRCFFPLLFIILFLTFVKSQDNKSKEGKDKLREAISKEAKLKSIEKTTTEKPKGKRQSKEKSKEKHKSKESKKKEKSIEKEEKFLKCQSKDGKFLSSATNCEDEAGLALCAENFPPNKKDVNTTRPTLCESPELFDEALQCAKTCKLCCEVKKKPNTATSSLLSTTRSEAEKAGVSGDSNTVCQDDPVFILECSFVKGKCKEEPWIAALKSRCEASCGACSTSSPSTCFDKHLRCSDVRTKKELCEDRQFGPLLQLRCAQSCGKCAPVSSATSTPSPVLCEDKSADCQRNANQCTNILYQTLMRDQCPKTCKYCINASKQGSSEKVAGKANGFICADTSTSCSAWNNNGFCSGNFYSLNTKIELCQKTCNLC